MNENNEKNFKEKLKSIIAGTNNEDLKQHLSDLALYYATSFDISVVSLIEDLNSEKEDDYYNDNIEEFNDDCDLIIAILNEQKKLVNNIVKNGFTACIEDIDMYLMTCILEDVCINDFWDDVKGCYIDEINALIELCDNYNIDIGSNAQDCIIG